MRIVVFTHSLTSCWNHGNAHFLRGVLRALQARGHTIRAFEPEGSWSRENLIQDGGEAGLAAFDEHYPELEAQFYPPDAPDLDVMLDGADLVLVHEWNPPALVAAIGARRVLGGQFLLLFHDTHHRAVSDPDAIRHFDLSGYDAVLAFGATLARFYERWGWGGRIFVWHEAADLRHFHPPVAPLTRSGTAAMARGGTAPAAREGAEPTERAGGVWIGNWGDGERSAELEEFLLAPMQAAGLGLDIYGVRYPDAAKATLERHGARLRGWLPNPQAPAVFARHLATVHVPRRYYVTMLPGIPTIRVFEALACGIPLLCAPWDDAEGLFTPGEDYLVAHDGDEMTRLLRDVARDADLRDTLVQHGLATIRARHSCDHRADELLSIAASLRRLPDRKIA